MSRPATLDSEAKATVHVITRLVALGFLVVVTVVLLGEAGHPRDDYLASITSKHRRLDALGSPKLVVIGGSNVAFGIDSRTLQVNIGIPVVNMGLAAGVGLPFMLREVEDRISSRDIVLLAPE